MCGQEIHEEKRFKGELKDALGKVDSFSTEIKTLSKNIDMLELDLKNLQDYTANKSKIELYEKQVETIKIQETDNQKKLDDLHEWHNHTDDDGRRSWYVPKHLHSEQERMVEMLFG